MMVGLIMIIIGATFGGDAIKGGTVEDKFGTYWSFAFLTGLLLGLWALIAGGLAVFKAMKLRITALVILLFVGGVGILFGASMILTTNAGGSWAVNIPMFFPKDFLADTLNNTKDELAYVDTGTHDVYGQDVESDLDSLFGNPPENAGLYLVDFINEPSTITTTHTIFTEAAFDGGLYCPPLTENGIADSPSRDAFHDFYLEGCPISGDTYFDAATWIESCPLAAVLCRINVDIQMKHVQWQNGVAVLIIGCLNLVAAFVLLFFSVKYHDRDIKSLDSVRRELKKNLTNKIFGYLARCDFWAKLGLRFWILVGYVYFLANFGAKFDFRV